VTTFDEVVGQEAALTTLRQALVNPVHAYLFIGSEGAGKKVAAKAFAAALVCETGGCGNCRNCLLAASDQHPDIVETSRTGAMVSVDDLRALAAISQRKPLEAARQILIVEDVHLAAKSAPALLKTLEEPPPSTIFVLLADDLPPELVTIASRCVEVQFPPLSTKIIAASLAANGCNPETARSVARASSGNLERAQLLAQDPAFAERVAMWTAIPSQLGGGGFEIAQLAADLLAATESSVQPMKERNAKDLAEREEQSKAMGERSLPGRKDLSDRYARIERRYRSDELRAGLGQLQRTYADLLADAVSSGSDQAETARRAGASIDAITEFVGTLRHNPNESLALQALFLKLTALRP